MSLALFSRYNFESKYLEKRNICVRMLCTQRACCVIVFISKCYRGDSLLLFTIKRKKPKMMTLIIKYNLYHHCGINIATIFFFIWYRFFIIFRQCVRNTNVLLHSSLTKYVKLIKEKRKQTNTISGAMYPLLMSNFFFFFTSQTNN